jgi:translocator protein
MGADRIPPLDRRSLYALVGFVLLCFGVAALAGSVTRPAIEGWYAGLQKPSYTPPDWVFAPVWSVLYAMMAVAAWRVWRSRGDAPGRQQAMRAFALQLGLNCMWSFAFFGAKSPELGLAVIVALLAAIAVAIALYRRLDRLAALLMAPYALWVGYAAALNVAIVALN